MSEKKIKGLPPGLHAEEQKILTRKHTRLGLSEKASLNRLLKVDYAVTRKVPLSVPVLH